VRCNWDSQLGRTGTVQLKREFRRFLPRQVQRDIDRVRILARIRPARNTGENIRRPIHFSQHFEQRQQLVGRTRGTVTHFPS